MSLKEACQIDVNNIDYYTLKDGTIIKIKREGEEALGSQFQGEGQYMSQNNQNTEEVFQGQSQLGQNNSIQNNFEFKQMSQSNISNQNKDNKQILQPGENYGYYISNEEGKYIQSQEKSSSNDNQMPQGYLNYNAQLINANAFNSLFLNQLQFKNLSLSGPQYFRFGPKRQLYKLVEAMPVRTNENKSSQVKSQQYNANSYMVDNSKYQFVKQEKNITSKEQLNQNNFVQLNLGRNFSFNQENMGYDNTGDQCTCQSGHL